MSTVTIEARLRRARGLAAVIQQATIATNGVYPDHFHAGLAELAELLADDLAAVARAPPTETANREAPAR
ncbi:MAG: hypothetical protein LC791_16180 [Acidobacteria bacterium]|nr:hypothetical protein [Acidobacteriota bacterium]